MARPKTVGGKGKKVGDRRLRQQAAKRKAQRQQDSAAAQRRRETQSFLDGLVRERFEPTQRALMSELRTAEAGPVAAQQAWNTYQDHLQAARAQSTAHFDQGVQRAATLGQNAQNNALATANAQLQAAGGENGGQGRAVQGGQADLGADIARTLGAYGATFQQDAQTAANANQARFDAARAQGAFMQQAQTREAVNQAIGVRNKLSLLEREKGDFRVKALQDLQRQEFEQDIAMRTLGLKESDLLLDQLRVQAGIEDDQADNARDDARLGLEGRRVDLQGQELARKIAQDAVRNRQRDRELDIKGQGKKAPKLSAAKKDQWRGRKARVLSLRDAFKGKMQTGRYRNTAQITAELKKLGYNRDELNMARDLAVLGYLSPANVRAAQGYFPGGYVPQGFTANAPGR